MSDSLCRYFSTSRSFVSQILWQWRLLRCLLKPFKVKSTALIQDMNGTNFLPFSLLRVTLVQYWLEWWGTTVAVFFTATSHSCRKNWRLKTTEKPCFWARVNSKPFFTVNSCVSWNSFCHALRNADWEKRGVTQRHPTTQTEPNLPKVSFPSPGKPFDKLSLHPNPASDNTHLAQIALAHQVIRLSSFSFWNLTAKPFHRTKERNTLSFYFEDRNVPSDSSITFNSPLSIIAAIVVAKWSILQSASPEIWWRGLLLGSFSNRRSMVHSSKEAIMGCRKSAFCTTKSKPIAFILDSSCNT